MKKDILGSLVSYERSRKDISLQMLARGVSSPAAIRRLEAGERMPDYFVLERIVERLGRSLNKVELLYDEKVYEIHYLRGLIEQCLEEKDYAEVQEALAYYESIPEGQEPIHKQYIYKIKGIVLSEKDKNHKAAAEMLGRALAETVADFDMEKIESFLLGEEELNLVILWMKEMWFQKDVDFKWNPEKLFSYIDRYCDDEEIKINIYSKAAWLIGTYYMEKEEYLEALRYTLRGQDVLAENGILLHMPEFLERILVLTKLCEEDSYKTWKAQRDALKSLYEEYEKPWAEETIALWKSYRQQEVYLYSEVFAQERKRRNLSQEKLADALEIDQKTISRIESGKYKPKAGTFKKLREYLEVERDLCTTRIVVDDFKLLEMEREIAKLISKRRVEEAWEIYEFLKNRMLLRYKENQQYIKYMDVLFASHRKEISHEEALQMCVETLSITRKNLDFTQIENIIYNRLEIFILNSIARCYQRIGDEKALIILEGIKRGFQNTKIDLKNYYPSVSLVYGNLADLYEEMCRYDDSIMGCELSIRYDMECKRGLNLGHSICEKRYAMDRKNGDNRNSQGAYKQAYQIFLLLKLKKERMSLQRVYKKWYGEEIL